jgi:hypothetical protein
MMKPLLIRLLMHRSGPQLLAVLLLCWVPSVWSHHSPEYELKAGFIYNFITYTEWPAEVGETINICVYGRDPFGSDLDVLQGKMVNDHRLDVQRVDELDHLESCQVVFISRSVRGRLAQVLNKLNGKPVLTIADTKSAARQGVMLNMVSRKNRIIFEANLAAAHANGLSLSSRLLRLATEVIR